MQLAPYVPDENLNRRFNNTFNQHKRLLNSIHNTIKSRYNRGNRSNTLKNMATRYTSSKNMHKKFSTSNYVRNSSYVRPTRLGAHMYFAQNPAAYRNYMNTRKETNAFKSYNNYIKYNTRKAANVIRSGRNVFENFKPRSVFPRFTQAEKNALRAEMNEIRAAENNSNMPELELAPNENNASLSKTAINKPKGPINNLPGPTAGSN
jgi:hypothetical protein